MGFSDLLGTFSAVALAGPAPTASSGGGLWDWVKTTAGSAWDYAQDLGAAVIERKVLPTPAPAPTPTPPLIQYMPAPGAGAPRYDWGMGGEVTTQPPLAAALGLTGMAPLLLVGLAAIFLMKGGK